VIAYVIQVKLDGVRHVSLFSGLLPTDRHLLHFFPNPVMSKGRVPRLGSGVVSVLILGIGCRNTCIFTVDSFLGRCSFLRVSRFHMVKLSALCGSWCSHHLGMGDSYSVTNCVLFVLAFCYWEGGVFRWRGSSGGFLGGGEGTGVGR